MGVRGGTVATGCTAVFAFAPPEAAPPEVVEGAVAAVPEAAGARAVVVAAAPDADGVRVAEVAAAPDADGSIARASSAKPRTATTVNPTLARSVPTLGKRRSEGRAGVVGAGTLPVAVWPVGGIIT